MNRNMGIAIGVALLAALAVLAYVYRDRLSGLIGGIGGGSHEAPGPSPSGKLNFQAIGAPVFHLGRG